MPRFASPLAKSAHRSYDQLRTDSCSLLSSSSSSSSPAQPSKAMKAHHYGPGRCPDCGTPTHRIVNKGIYGRRRELLPLTITGQVHLGRCLVCCDAGGGSATIDPFSAAAGGEGTEGGVGVSPRSAMDISEFDVTSDQQGGKSNGNTNDDGLSLPPPPASPDETVLFDASQSTIQPPTPSKLLFDASASDSTIVLESESSFISKDASADELNSEYASILARLSQIAPRSPEVRRLVELSRVDAATGNNNNNVSTDKDADDGVDEADDDDDDGDVPSPTADILNRIDTLRNCTSTSDETAVRESCVALRRAAVANRTVIAAYGGINAITTNAMVPFESSLEVQRAAIGAIQNLACSYETDRLVSAEGGVAAIVKAMHIHDQSAGLQRSACAALRNLSLSCVPNRTIIAREGGLIAIVKAMRDHTDDVRVVETACAALANLCIRNADNRVEIGELGGVTAVLEALRDYGTGSLSLAEKAVKALLNLSYHRGNVETIKGFEEGGVADLVLGVGVKHGGRCREWAVRLWLRL